MFSKIYKLFVLSYCLLANYNIYGQNIKSESTDNQIKYDVTNNDISEQNNVLLGDWDLLDISYYGGFIHGSDIPGVEASLNISTSENENAFVIDFENIVYEDEYPLYSFLQEILNNYSDSLLTINYIEEITLSDNGFYVSEENYIAIELINDPETNEEVLNLYLGDWSVIAVDGSISLYRFTRSSNEIGTSANTTLNGWKAEVFPNPFTDRINIQVPPEEIYSIKIYDQQGKLIAQYRSNFETLSLGYLQSGLYLLKINNSQGESQTFKILKTE